MCSYNKVNGVYASAAPLAADRGAARGVGLRRPGRLRLGRRARPGRRGGRRARPGDAAEARRQRPRGRRRRCGRGRWTRPCSTGRRAGCSRSSTARSRRPTPAAALDARRAPRPGPAGRGARARCCSRTTALLPLRHAPGPDGRGDRRVRPHPALPGRRQLPGQPDPGRRPARRAARRACPTASRSRSPPGSATGDDRATRTWRRGGRAAAGADVVVRLPRPARRRRVRGLRPRRTWTCPPTRPPAAPGSPAANADVVVVLANGSAVLTVDLGPRRGGPGVLAGRAGRRRRGRRPAARRGQPVRPAGRDDSAAAGGQPVVPEFPGEAGHVRYGEGIFVGYRGYDALDRPVAYPFGHGLSYTTFAYADLDHRRGQPTRRRPAVTVRCTVTNTGDRAGQEVVQVYVGDRGRRSPGRRAS